MQLNLENPHDPLRIQRYDRSEIQLADVAYRHSLLLLPKQAPAAWDCTEIANLRPEDCVVLTANRPEIVLLGSGARHAFPDIEVLRFFQQQGIGLEVMETGAACRTWNVLLNEGRAICAGLILSTD